MDKQGKAKVVCYIHGPPASYVTHPLTYFMCDDDDHSIWSGHLTKKSK
jgi:hypothetical protein